MTPVRVGVGCAQNREGSRGHQAARAGRGVALLPSTSTKGPFGRVTAVTAFCAPSQRQQPTHDRKARRKKNPGPAGARQQSTAPGDVSTCRRTSNRLLLLRFSLSCFRPFRRLSPPLKSEGRAGIDRSFCAGSDGGMTEQQIYR
mmetsp:Transcript_20237/g.41267  ORF Transcript_20237/g.41267 Transcript_20237/m.41267 type:complete len:144 (-) Transcript_20237:249-680(-)